MIRKTILGLFSILVITSALSPVYAEIMSPLQQLNDGIENNMIQCNTDKVLVESPNGKPACVYETTAEKLVNRGWIILDEIKINNVSLDSNVERYTVEEYFGGTEPTMLPFNNVEFILDGSPKVGETAELILSTVYEVKILTGDLLDENGDYIFDENGDLIPYTYMREYRIENPLIRMSICDGDGTNYKVTNIVSNVNTGDPKIFEPYDVNTQSTTAIIGYPYVAKGTVEILQEGFHYFCGYGLEGDVDVILEQAVGYDKSITLSMYRVNGDTFLDHTLPVIGESEEFIEYMPVPPSDPIFADEDEPVQTHEEFVDQFEEGIASHYIKENSPPKDVLKELVHHKFTIQYMREFLENKMHYSENVINDLIDTLPNDYLGSLSFVTDSPNHNP